MCDDVAGNLAPARGDFDIIKFEDDGSVRIANLRNGGDEIKVRVGVLPGFGEFTFNLHYSCPILSDFYQEPDPSLQVASTFIAVKNTELRSDNAGCPGVSFAASEPDLWSFACPCAFDAPSERLPLHVVAPSSAYTT
ncbi:hypothetical protein [Sulfitobacter aestuariivivens]|uniref:hypothetical protein n=1 Tax=Sulfitobacter aestuariivivens TaxID=2766981 RepID=UPI00361BFAF7